MLEEPENGNKDVMAIAISSFEFPIWENHVTTECSVTPSTEGY